MSKEDLCSKCTHKRSVHPKTLGSDESKCTWPGFNKDT